MLSKASFMDQAALQSIFTATQTHLTADGAGALSEAGMSSGLALLALRLLEAMAAVDDQDEVSDLLKDLVGVAHRRELRRALTSDLVLMLVTLDRDPPLRGACQALVDALGGNAKPTDAPTSHQGMEAREGSSISNSPQTIVQGNQIINPPPADPAEAQRQRALLTYLESTASQCNALPLGQLDPTDAAHRRPMELARVYIGLQTTEQIELTDDEKQWREQQSRRNISDRETRPLTALEALGRATQSRLMLLGAPGSGKSTFVSHLALCLAGAALVERRANVPQPEGGWLTKVPNWTLGALLPIRVVLRDFAAFDKLTASKTGSVSLFLDFLQSTLLESGCEAALELLTTALAEGRAILLLDGFDEVVGDTVLMRVHESIAAMARTYQRSPILVTCRILDYQGSRRRQLAGFPTQMLADLTDDQIGQFIDDWYAELAASGRRPIAEARADAAVLRQATSARDELRGLARLPLLLTVMALVHTNRGTLPDARTLLYQECIELLLLRWRQPRGENDLLARLNLSQFRASDLLVLMARLGFAAHELAERFVEPQSRPADLSELEVMRLLSEGFAQYDPSRRYELAQQVLDALASGNGLLLKRGPDTYTFPHRTFQEFLAGFHLMRQRDYLKECLQRAPQTHWHEALLLMAGYQVLAGNELEKPLALAEKLLERSLTEQALAGELLNLIGRERAASYDPALVKGTGLWPRARGVLLRLAAKGQAPEAPATLRVRAGTALGTLCFGTLATLCQPDVLVPLPDPRLPLAVIGLPIQKLPSWRQALDVYWCPVEAGTFWYGDDNDKRTLLRGPLHKTTIDYPFKIARYPITNADFARFVAAGGYHERHWWTDNGWKWRDQHNKIAPSFFEEPGYNNPIQPIIAVSWYEAAAYCIWLTDQGHTAGWLPQTDEIRLPTSLEWERAARGTDQRRFPWGQDVLTSERANYRETGIGAPSPIGCFPHDVATCGASEMLGNVAEWLTTPYKTPTQQKVEKDFTTHDGILMTWNEYGSNKEQMCCGSRDGSGPSRWNNFLGFRIVWSLIAHN